MPARPFKLTMIEPRETEIVAAITDAITRLRLGVVIRYNCGGFVDSTKRYVRFNNAPGHSDLAGALRPTGQAFYLEVKRPGGKPTVEQQQFLDAMAATGAIAACVHSIDEALTALGHVRLT